VLESCGPEKLRRGGDVQAQVNLQTLRRHGQRLDKQVRDPIQMLCVQVSAVGLSGRSKLTGMADRPDEDDALNIGLPGVGEAARSLAVDKWMT
jgi:hypothetical protein